MNDIKNRITIMGEVFVHDKIIEPSVLSTDSKLVKAKGHVWYKSSMKEGVGTTFLVLILMQCGYSAIQRRVGYLGTNYI